MNRGKTRSTFSRSEATAASGRSRQQDERFLINRAIEQPVVTPVTLVQAWAQGLR
jgi:hypothetical protein